MPNKILELLERLRDSVDEEKENITKQKAANDNMIDSSIKDMFQDEVVFEQINRKVEKLDQVVGSLSIRRDSVLLQKYIDTKKQFNLDKKKYSLLRKKYEEFYREKANFSRLTLNPPVSTSYENDHSLWRRSQQAFENKIRYYRMEKTRISSLLDIFENEPKYLDELKKIEAELKWYENHKKDGPFLDILRERMINYQPDLLDMNDRPLFYKFVYLLKDCNDAILSDLDTLTTLTKYMKKNHISKKNDLNLFKDKSSHSKNK